MNLEGGSELRLPDALCPSVLLLGSLILPREQAQDNQLEDEKTAWNRAVFLAETILDQPASSQRADVHSRPAEPGQASLGL